MKQLFFATFLSVLPVVSHAVTADSFDCTMSIEDSLTGDGIVQRSSFQVVRMPLSQSPAPDVRLTAGEIKFNGELKDRDRHLGADFEIVYDQAVKLDSKGHIMDPRQTSCVAFETSACSNNATQCTVSGSSCGMSANPYDPTYGWTPVPNAGGVPAFDSKILMPVYTVNISDENQKHVGTASVICHYTGTYQ